MPVVTEEGRFNDEATIRNAEDVLRAVLADFTGDDELLKEVLGRYRAVELHALPEVQDFLATALAMVSLLVHEIAQLKRLNEEQVIDELLLELS